LRLFFCVLCGSSLRFFFAVFLRVLCGFALRALRLNAFHPPDIRGTYHSGFPYIETMSTMFRYKSVAWGVLVICLSFGGRAFADAGSMNCPGTMPSPHAQLAEGDQNTASRLQMTRKISPDAEFRLDICDADLTMSASKDDVLRVTVDIRNISGKFTAADYLKTFDVTAHTVTLQLQLPKSLRARVLVELPATTPELRIDLGRGDLSLATNHIGGRREINVGYGHVALQGNDDSYASLQVNIGLGSLHDNRRGGENHHLIVSRDLDGTGRGAIEINVGMGSVDLNPGENHPI
jgi:hypothetical protein